MKIPHNQELALRISLNKPIFDSGQSLQHASRLVMKLSELKPGARCVVERCEGVPCRLLEMGLLPGAEVEVTRFAPFGGPVCLRVQRCLLAIRKEDASQIEVLSV